MEFGLLVFFRAFGYQLAKWLPIQFASANDRIVYILHSLLSFEFMWFCFFFFFVFKLNYYSKFQLNFDKALNICLKKINWIQFTKQAIIVNLLFLFIVKMGWGRSWMLRTKNIILRKVEWMPWAGTNSMRNFTRINGAQQLTRCPFGYVWMRH